MTQLETMETEYDQVLNSVAHVKIADKTCDSADVNQDEDGVKVSCFTEVLDDVTLHFQIIHLAKQVLPLFFLVFLIFIKTKSGPCYDCRFMYGSVTIPPNLGIFMQPLRPDRLVHQKPVLSV